MLEYRKEGILLSFLYWKDAICLKNVWVCFTNFHKKFRGIMPNSSLLSTVWEFKTQTRKFLCVLGSSKVLGLFSINCQTIYTDFDHTSRYFSYLVSYKGCRYIVLNAPRLIFQSISKSIAFASLDFGKEYPVYM